MVPCRFNLVTSCIPQQRVCIPKVGRTPIPMASMQMPLLDAVAFFGHIFCISADVADTNIDSWIPDKVQYVLIFMFHLLIYVWEAGSSSRTIVRLREALYSGIARNLEMVVRTVVREGIC